MNVHENKVYTTKTDYDEIQKSIERYRKETGYEGPTLYKAITVPAGFSDIASLVYRFCEGGTGELDFHGDDDYECYIIDDSVNVPSHYDEFVSGETWVWIYDDIGKVISIRAPYISIYRSGGYSLLIQVRKSN